MGIRRVVVLHGYRASPSSHWFSWLQEELGGSGIRTEVPSLPDSSAPDRAEWVAAAVRSIGAPDDQLAVVGHSLGAVTALHALDLLPGAWTLGAFVAVAGFVSPLPTLPELAPFTRQGPDTTRTAARTGRRAAFLSDNDTIVPPALTRELGGLLEAERTVVPGAGHFLTSDGIDQFPALAELLRSA